MLLRPMVTDRSVLVFGFALLIVPVACGEDAKPPAGVAPPAAGQGGKGASGGRGGSGGKGGTSGSGASSGAQSAGEGGAGGDPGSGGDAGAGGATGGGGGSGGSAGVGGGGGEGGTPMEPSLDCPPEPTSGTPPASTPICDIDTVWGVGERVSVPTTGNDVLVSVTPDELSISWASVDVFSTVFFVADRATAAVDFGAPMEIVDPLVTEDSQLALSPDGLRLVLVVGARFLEATRVQRGDTFGTADEGGFSLVNAAADMDGTSLGDPVISPDDLTLYYSARGVSDDTLRVSSRTGSEPWPVGRPLGECEFKAHPGGGRIPTAVSSDGLTLFYFDNPRNVMRAAFRPALDWPFLEFVDLPGRYSAQPNGACDQLYYSGMGVLPVELLVAAPE